LEYGFNFLKIYLHCLYFKSIIMKKTLNSLIVIAIILISIAFASCNSAVADADIKMGAEKAMKADPMSAKLSVDVKDGVATITGECMDSICKDHCTKLVEGVKGVKSVVSNCTIAPKVEQPTALSDADLNKRLYELTNDLDAVKSIKIGSMDGVVAIAGPISKKEWTALKTEIDKLRPKGYDTTMLNVQD
jgi:hyperosmotically inducible periplasmic protein